MRYKIIFGSNYIDIFTNFQDMTMQTVEQAQEITHGQIYICLYDGSMAYMNGGIVFRVQFFFSLWSVFLFSFSHSFIHSSIIIISIL